MVWKNGLQRIVLLLFLWWNLVEILHYWVLVQSCLLKERKKEKRKNKNEMEMQLLEANSCEPLLQRHLACF